MRRTTIRTLAVAAVLSLVAWGLSGNPARATVQRQWGPWQPAGNAYNVSGLAVTHGVGTILWAVTRDNGLWWTSPVNETVTGWHYIGSGITAISAGQQGILTYLSSGNAYWWNEASASPSLIGTGVAQVTTGTDVLARPSK